MKKLFAMLLTLALSLSLLAGCGSAPSESAAPSDNAAPSEAAPAGDAAPRKRQKAPDRHRAGHGAPLPRPDPHLLFG